tara:strand:+ start:971 stop:2644 length:1674 start_codon:yes stop_codon:yes gene_type:complete
MFQMIDITSNKKKTFDKIIVFSFFLIFFIVGTRIFTSYGIPIDAEANKILGYMTMNYINEIFFNSELSNTNSSSLNDYLQGNKDTAAWWYDLSHGAFLVTIFAYFDVLFGIEETKTQYFIRHYSCFVLFFISVYFFYLIGKFRFKSRKFGLLGCIFLVLSPRIFAESFYNVKDIVFLSLFIISLYCCLKYIYKPSLKHSIFFSLTAALATDIRVMGIMLPILVCFFILILSLREKNFFNKNYLNIIFFLFLTPLFMYIFWPYLWPDPIDNFIIAFKTLSDFPLDIKNLYFGDYIYSYYLPWHYSLIWIFITTPIIYLFFFVFGFIVSSNRLLQRLLNIDERKKFNDLWRGKIEMIDLMILLNFFIPIFLIIILNSTLHDGWRQLYFVYPSLLLLSVYGIEKIINKIKKKKIYTYFVVIIVIVLFINLINMIKIHPHQYAYFNFLAGKNVEKNFEVDYWGVSNKQAIEHILLTDMNKYKIYAASNMDLYSSKLIFSEYEKKKIEIVGKKSDADFIITNRRFWSGDTNASFAKIPDNFEIFKEIRTDRAIIVSIYKKSF